MSLAFTNEAYMENLSRFFVNPLMLNTSARKFS